MTKQHLEISAWEINRLNETLEDALRVLSNVDGSDEYERSYPYGTGYGKSAIRQTLQTIARWKEELSND
jgi:pantoate kinase